MEGLWPLLKAIRLLSFAVWTAAGLGAYLAVRDICNDDILAKYRRVAHLQALALAALGATGLSMAHALGFPSWTKATALRPPSGPRASAHLGDGKLHKAEQMGQRLDAHMDSATYSHPIPQALQTHTRPVTQAAAYSPRGTPRGWAQPPAKEVAQCMRDSNFYAKPAHACS